MNKNIQNKIKNNKTLRTLAALALIFLIAYEFLTYDPLTDIPYDEPPATTDAPTTAPAADAEADLSGPLKITMIDVGQGDSILISAGGEHMIIDTNTTSSYDSVRKTLEENGIEKLTYVVATHPHADHIGSMGYLVEDFTPDVYYYTDRSADTVAYKKAMEAAENYAGSMELLTRGDSFTLGGATFTVLSPVKGYESDNINNYSCVLLLEYGEFSALLTGDAEKPIERELVKEGLVPDVDLLKVGHHGSYTSSSEEFLKAAAPELALISLGEDNDYGYPHQITLDKLADIGAEVYRTDLIGTFTVTADKDGNITVE